MLAQGLRTNENKESNLCWPEPATCGCCWLLLAVVLLLLASVVLKFIRRSAPGGVSWSSFRSILATQPVGVVDLVSTT